MSHPLLFVDVEAGPAPGRSHMTEFGVVRYPAMETFHGGDGKGGKLTVSTQAGRDDVALWTPEFNRLAAWLGEVPGPNIMVSDNPAFDFQWVNYYSWACLGIGLFGHSARRISDYYAGLMNDWHNTQKWKRLRITKHDHNPVHDALGNAEAWARLQKGER
jgi:hypothetical protein